MARRDEPGSINFERRTGGDPLLEPVGMGYRPNTNNYIMVCGMGSRVIWIRWAGMNVDEARDTFRTWLAAPWQTLTTDFTGVGVPNGLDFKPGRIDWFNIAD